MITVAILLLFFAPVLLALPGALRQGRHSAAPIRPRSSASGTHVWPSCNAKRFAACDWKRIEGHPICDNLTRPAKDIYGIGAAVRCPVCVRAFIVNRHLKAANVLVGRDQSLISRGETPCIQLQLERG